MLRWSKPLRTSPRLGKKTCPWTRRKSLSSHLIPKEVLLTRYYSILAAPALPNCSNPLQTKRKPCETTSKLRKKVFPQGQTPVCKSRSTHRRLTDYLIPYSSHTTATNLQQSPPDNPPTSAEESSEASEQREDTVSPMPAAAAADTGNALKLAADTAVSPSILVKKRKRAPLVRRPTGEPTIAEGLGTRRSRRGALTPADEASEKPVKYVTNPRFK